MRGCLSKEVALTFNVSIVFCFCEKSIKVWNCFNLSKCCSICLILTPEALVLVFAKKSWKKNEMTLSRFEYRNGLSAQPNFHIRLPTCMHQRSVHLSLSYSFLLLFLSYVGVTYFYLFIPITSSSIRLYLFAHPSMMMAVVLLHCLRTIFFNYNA